jgi:hypothetical protein
MPGISKFAGTSPAAITTYRPSNISPYLYCGWADEARPTMERCDTGFREPFFAPFWNGLREGALEAH